jgi:hypothetical protein
MPTNQLVLAVNESNCRRLQQALAADAVGELLDPAVVVLLHLKRAVFNLIKWDVYDGPLVFSGRSGFTRLRKGIGTRAEGWDLALQRIA